MFELSGVRVIWGSSYLGFELSGVRVIWGSSYLGFELSGVRVIGGSSYRDYTVFVVLQFRGQLQTIDDADQR